MNAPSGSSIARVSLGGDWVVAPNPGPYDHYFSYDCGGVISTETNTGSTVKALYR